MGVSTVDSNSTEIIVRRVPRHSYLSCISRFWRRAVEASKFPAISWLQVAAYELQRDPYTSLPTNRLSGGVITGANVSAPKRTMKISIYE